MAIAPYIVSFRYNHRWWSDLWICWGISWSTLAQTLVLWTGVSQYCLQHAFPVCANFLHLNLFFVMISFLFLYTICSLSSFRKKHYTRRHVVPEVVLVLAYGCLVIQPELIQWKSDICGAPRIFHVLPGTRRTDFGDPSISDLVRFSPEKLPGLFNARNSVIWKLQSISYYEYLW